MPLLSIWSDAKESVLEMSIQQVVSVAGDGKLLDQSECSNELRYFLSQVDRQHLWKYAQECLEQSFENSGFVLQDVINEVGRRFGLNVGNGIYRGKRQHNNCDGIWKSKQQTRIR